jgi:hypothetical protein
MTVVNSVLATQQIGVQPLPQWEMHSPLSTSGLGELLLTLRQEAITHASSLITPLSSVGVTERSADSDKETQITSEILQVKSQVCHPYRSTPLCLQLPYSLDQQVTA